MKYFKFINLSAHELTAQQVEALKSFGTAEIIPVPSNLKGQLINCPSELEGLKALLKNLLIWVKLIQDDDDNFFGSRLYIHLPIGSPAFMWLLATELPALGKRGYPLHILFSHTERKSVETVMPDGTTKKESIFEFVKYIQI